MLGGVGGAGRFQYAVLEATPLAEDGYLYVIAGWGVITKLDVRSGDRAFPEWRMDHDTDSVMASPNSSRTCLRIAPSAPRFTIRPTFAASATSARGTSSASHFAG